MSNNILSTLSMGAGCLTTLYGAYSYMHSGKGISEKSKHQQKVAKLTMAIGIGLIACGISVSYLSTEAALDSRIPKYLRPYVNNLQEKGSPKPPLTKFPPYLWQFLHPERVATESGHMCTIPAKLPPLLHCEVASEKILDVFKEQATSEQLYEAFNHPGSVWGGGYTVEFPFPTFKRFSFGMNATIVKNYKEGLEFAEKTMLQDPNFCSKNSTEMVDFFKKLHGIFTVNVKSEMGDSILSGQFRNVSLLIFDDKTHQSQEGFMDFLTKNRGTKEDFQNVGSFFDKLRTLGTEIGLKSLTEGEIQTVSKVAHLTPAPELVEPKMREFGARFGETCTLIKEGIVPPNAGGSWAHQSFGKDIHPFENWNGREGRTLMNGLRAIGGEEAIIVPDDKKYTAAIIQDHKTPGYFARWIEILAMWNREQTFNPF